MNQETILCSNCFENQGLKLDSFKLGAFENSICPNCKTSDGKKLNKENALELSRRFFVRGSIYKSQYGANPLIQFNELTTTDLDLGKDLDNDISLLSEKLKIGFFRYGPRLWMVGENDSLKSLQNIDERETIFKRISTDYPTCFLNEGDNFYRLRKNPQFPDRPNQYDSSPNPGSGRFDYSDSPVLYCSEDLEVCIHECRVTVEDELFIATLKPRTDLKILDLSELLEEDVTEFESLDLAIHMLFNAGSYSYEISRDLAKYLKNLGYDGIIYPSFFSTLRTGATPFETIFGISVRKLPLYSNYAKSQIVPNIALFGYPISEDKISVTCINKLILNKVEYDFIFGPVM